MEWGTLLSIKEASLKLGLRRSANSELDGVAEDSESPVCASLALRMAFADTIAS